MLGKLEMVSEAGVSGRAAVHSVACSCVVRAGPALDSLTPCWLSASGLGSCCNPLFERCLGVQRSCLEGSCNWSESAAVPDRTAVERAAGETAARELGPGSHRGTQGELRAAKPGLLS